MVNGVSLCPMASVPSHLPVRPHMGLAVTTHIEGNTATFFYEREGHTVLGFSQTPTVLCFFAKTLLGLVSVPSHLPVRAHLPDV